MSSVVCTLFEGHYEKGLAALINSLYCNGYKGAVYAGYRGNLTSWALESKDNPALSWPNSKTLMIAEDFHINFLPINTHYHFSNYKPQFMLDLMEGDAKQASGIIYFDPDIVIKCNWRFYENWISYGVALVHEIINHDMPYNNPTRFMWSEMIEKNGRKVTRLLNSYFNSGFCGVAKNNYEFIKVWNEIINFAINNYKYDPSVFMLEDKTSIICCDQDGLNITAMCSDSPLSEMGPQAMDFIHGGFTMSHATASPKPWKKNFIVSALKGIKPSIQEKQFWLNVSFPISAYSSTKIRTKKISIMIANLIGRFYNRS